MNDMNIHKFNLSNMLIAKDNKLRIIIIGMQNSGKTFLCRDILHTFRDRLISGNIVTDFNNFELTTIIESIKSKSFLIIDDVFYDEGIIHKDIKNLCSNNPFDVFIYTCNYILDKEIVKEADYIFISPSKIESILRRLYSYCSDNIKIDFLEFTKICKIVYDCHHFLVIDNTIKSCNREDYIFWYKAERVDSLKIGINDYGEILI